MGIYTAKYTLLLIIKYVIWEIINVMHDFMLWLYSKSPLSCYWYVSEIGRVQGSIMSLIEASWKWRCTGLGTHIYRIRWLNVIRTYIHIQCRGRSGPVNGFNACRDIIAEQLDKHVCDWHIYTGQVLYRLWSMMEGKVNDLSTFSSGPMLGQCWPALTQHRPTTKCLGWHIQKI